MSLKILKQVRSDNDASELEILGHLGTFFDILGHIETIRKTCRRVFKPLDCFPSHFRPFSPIIGSLKKTRSGRTDGQTLL